MFIIVQHTAAHQQVVTISVKDNKLSRWSMLVTLQVYLQYLKYLSLCELSDNAKVFSCPTILTQLLKCNPAILHFNSL